MLDEGPIGEGFELLAESEAVGSSEGASMVSPDPQNASKLCRRGERGSFDTAAAVTLPVPSHVSSFTLLKDDRCARQTVGVVQLREGNETDLITVDADGWQGLIRSSSLASSALLRL